MAVQGSNLKGAMEAFAPLTSNDLKCEGASLSPKSSKMLPKKCQFQALQSIKKKRL